MFFFSLFVPKAMFQVLQIFAEPNFSRIQISITVDAEAAVLLWNIKQKRHLLGLSQKKHLNNLELAYENVNVTIAIAGESLQV